MLRPISQDASDWPLFVEALADADLPTSDLDAAGQHFFSLNSATAFGGYVIAGPDALLRSVVIPSSARGRGLGRALVMTLLQQLDDQDVERAWLLTTSAGPFFERLGFAPVDRATAPTAISATPQFHSICPSNATLMCRPLTVANLDQETSA